MAKTAIRTESEGIRRFTLQLPRSEAEERLKLRVDLGKELENRKINSKQELRKAETDEEKWSDYNDELLRRIVDTDDLYNDYHPTYSISLYESSSLGEQYADFLQEVGRKVNLLESIISRLELIPETEEVQTPLTSKQHYKKVGSRVFLVHGHDEEAKQSVARLIEKFGLDAIILHEQPNQGFTIIEKFENYSDVGFAVVLLTPDDVGSAKPTPDQLVSRARQNVILELGFFLGKLGRENVCALHKGNVEIPSDFSGVLWVNMDAEGAWRVSLAREMKVAGLDVDLNKL